MLNKNSIEVLKSINSITNSAIISYPVTTITNAKRDIYGNIDFSKIDDEGWKDFGIMDLNSFLNAIDILEDPVIKQDNIYIRANDPNSKIEFVTSYPSTLEDFSADPDIVSTTAAAPSVLEVPIDTDLIAKIKKGSSVFKNLKDLFIVKKGDEVYLKSGNKETFNRTQNSYTIHLDPILNINNDFEIVIPIENFLSLPSMDFTMKVKYNEKKDEYRLILENEIFQFLFTLKN
jgi:hypothetical protein